MDIKYRGQALLHGDLHTGSVMVTPEATVVIDSEFSFYGPMGFDIGALLSNLLLSYYSQDGHSTEKNREGYKKWILQQVEELWNKFEKKFIHLWNTEHTGDVYAPSFFKGNEKEFEMAQKGFMLNLFHDSLGFTAAKMIR